MRSLKSVIKAILRRVGLQPVGAGARPAPPSSLELCLEGLRRVGFEPRCLVDVGANHGNWTRTALRYFPNLTVAMVEPQDWLRSSVADLLDSNRNLHWVVAGASDAESKLLLTVRERDDSSNFLLSAEQAAREGYRQVEVRVTTVERLVKELNLPAPDIIKIDAEGLDLKVLAGCGPFLGRTDLFFVEASLMSGAKENAFLEIVQFMKGRGYRLFDVTDLNRSPNCGLLCLVEMAFVREGSWLEGQTKW